jgi:hypothetical protein
MADELFYGNSLGRKNGTYYLNSFMREETKPAAAGLNIAERQ